MIDAAERLLAIDRTHERAWQALIGAQIRRGDRAAALATFDRCAIALAETSQLMPCAETQALIAGIRAPQAAAVAIPSGDDAGAARLPPAAFPGRSATRLRLGVLPLRWLHAGQQDDLPAALAEEVISALSRFRRLSAVIVPALVVIGGHHAGLTGQGSDVDLLLGGTIQRVANRVRVLVRLSDTRAAGEVIWARRFDGEATDVLALQDGIAGEIAAQLHMELLLRLGEVAQCRADPTAYEMVLQAIPAIYRMERLGFRAAGQLLSAAVKADPGSAAAYTWSAYWNLLLAGQRWAEHPASARVRAAELAEHAVALDPSDARALALAGHLRSLLHKRPGEARALHDRAVALNPSLALAWCLSGLNHCYLGEHDEAIRCMRKAQRLSPYDPHAFLYDMALTLPQVLRQDYAAAAETGRRAIDLNPGYASSYQGYLAALGHLGSTQTAADVWARLLILDPRFCVAAAVACSPLIRPADVTLYADGLRMAGIPEEHERPAALSPGATIANT